jgi:hypothetical protein
MKSEAATRNTGTIIVATALRERIRVDVDRDGLRRTADRIGMSESALASLLAGLGVRRGTAALAASHYPDAAQHAR